MHNLAEISRQEKVLTTAKAWSSVFKGTMHLLHRVHCFGAVQDNKLLFMIKLQCNLPNLYSSVSFAFLNKSVIVPLAVVRNWFGSHSVLVQEQPLH